jgi:hypothetical protein
MPEFSGSCSVSLVEHDLVAKPAFTFPDHALVPTAAMSNFCAISRLKVVIRSGERTRRGASIGTSASTDSNCGMTFSKKMLFEALLYLEANFDCREVTYLCQDKCIK